MTKHTANHAPLLASQASITELIGQFSKAAARLLSIRNSSVATAELSTAIRYDVGEEDCRPARPQSLHALQSSQQRSLDRMRMRSF